MYADLEKISQQLRLTVLKMIYKAKSGHIGGSLSCMEILTILFYKFMNIRPLEPAWPERDRFILSKGHAAPALYAIMAGKGYFDSGELWTLRQMDSCLQGHPCMFKLDGIDISTGSLGMGLSVGIGMALAAKLLSKSYRVFVLCGDGEMQEGQNWEALMSANKWKLDNITVIIDRNNVQLDGTTQQVMPLGDLAGKLEAFGMGVVKCNGHDFKSLCKAVNSSIELDGPSAIIAETVKGKGVSFMEGQSAWHGKRMSEQDYQQAINELEEALL